MDYYLVPGEVAGKLNLTEIRKRTPDGMFLLSESDLLPYGAERAKEEGAVMLSNERRQDTIPADEGDNGEQDNDVSQEQNANENEGEQEKEEGDV